MRMEGGGQDYSTNERGTGYAPSEDTATTPSIFRRICAQARSFPSDELGARRVIALVEVLFVRSSPASKVAALDDQ